MTTSGETPAGWHADPSKVGDLRYHDGNQWTEHITCDGVQTTAPFETLDAPRVSGFTMHRIAQWRTQAEKALELIGPTGVMGRFVPLLDGAPGYRLQDPEGGTEFAVSKPSLKSAVEIADPAGYLVGTITKIGRLHSRYDVTLSDRHAIATVKLTSGATDAWETQFEGTPGATITRTITSPADPLNLAGVDYAVAIAVPLDDQLQPLLLAVPLAIDILDTQAL